MSRVFIIAGEPSGDVLGARVMASLKKLNGKTLFSGVGGPAMAGQGLKSMFPMSEISVMGLAEVLPRIPNLLARIAETSAAAERDEPAVIVTIDSPDFCFRAARRVKSRRPDIPIVHIVAPSVWAWRAGRAKKAAQFLDRMLCLLPFEPPYFEREGLDAAFIGHPAAESGADKADGAAFRARLKIPEDRPLLAVLPGSRAGEIKRHVPVFRETVRLLQERAPGLLCVTAEAGGGAGAGGSGGDARRAMAGWSAELIVAENEADKFAAFAAADAALAASGTVSVELALAGCPGVIAYKVNPLTALAAKHMLRIKHVSLINLISDRRVIPEFLQRDCRADKLADAVNLLLTDKAARDAQKDAFAPALAALGGGGEAPSMRAAKLIEESMRQQGR